MTFSNSARLLFAAFAACAAANAAAIFNFDTDNPGTSTTFTDTSNGLSATFSSSADPGGFVLEEANFFDTLTGNVLGDPGPAGQDNLTAYENSTPVGSNTLAGQFLPGLLFPEGEFPSEEQPLTTWCSPPPLPNPAEQHRNCGPVDGRGIGLQTRLRTHSLEFYTAARRSIDIESR